MDVEQTLKDAIEGKEELEFLYDNKPRTVRPVSLRGAALLAWQVEGESSRPLPCIAHYTVSKIEGLKATGRTFTEYPDGWEPKKE